MKVLSGSISEQPVMLEMTPSPVANKNALNVCDFINNS
jgi:hypothetical protein